MANYWLILIPSHPDFLPSSDAQARALETYRRFVPQADEVRIEISATRRFIYCGAMLEQITCPTCHRLFDLEAWGDWMSVEAELEFPLNPAPMPCCGAQLTLSDLVYVWPQGFAKFTLEAMNPGIADLSESQFHELETILGCNLRKIWRRL